MFSQNGLLPKSGTEKDVVSLFFSFLNLLNKSCMLAMITIFLLVFFFEIFEMRCERAYISVHLGQTLTFWTQTPKHSPASAQRRFLFPEGFCSVCLSGLSYPPCSAAFPISLGLPVWDS